MTENPTGMTDEDRRDYAAHLVLEHARQVEFLSVFEMFEEYSEDGGEISEADARAVLNLVETSDVTVGWSDSEPVPDATVQEGQN